MPLHKFRSQDQFIAIMLHYRDAGDCNFSLIHWEKCDEACVPDSQLVRTRLFGTRPAQQALRPQQQAGLLAGPPHNLLAE